MVIIFITACYYYFVILVTIFKLFKVSLYLYIIYVLLSVATEDPDIIRISEALRDEVDYLLVNYCAKSLQINDGMYLL